MKIIFIFLFSLNIFAMDCGEYKIRGKVVELHKGKLTIVVNEKTKSEILIETTKEPQLKLIAYENKEVLMQGNIIKFDGVSRAILDKIISIEYKVANPMMPTENTGIELIKKSECKKNEK